MSNWTEDGACVPHWMAMSDAYEQGAKGYRFTQDNSNLKQGYVVAVHYPGEPNYESSKEIKYDVICAVSEGLDTSAWHLYTNARLGMRFGGSTKDFLVMTIRCPLAKYDPSKGLTEELRAESSCVLIECENGQSHSPIIVGFGRHANLPDDTKLLGHNYRWDFNGISTTISKDGEYAITYSGAILDANTNSYIAAPAATTGTYMKFTKEGSWTANNVAGESILLDKAASKSTFMGRSMLIQTSEGDLNVLSKGKTNVQAQGNAVFNSTKKVYIGTEGSTEPLVKGNQLAGALKMLVDILSVPVIGQAGPFPCMSLIAPQLRAWAAIYAAKNRSPFLSRKGYVS